MGELVSEGDTLIISALSFLTNLLKNSHLQVEHSLGGDIGLSIDKTPASIQNIEEMGLSLIRQTSRHIGIVV